MNTRLVLLLLVPILLLAQGGTFHFTSSQLISSVSPEYTEEARQAGLQGTVSLYAEIDTKGEPTNIRVLHGLGLGLDEKAIQAAQQWRFKPNAIGGKAVRRGQSIDIDFHLEGSNSWRIRLAAYSLQQDTRKNEMTESPALISYSVPNEASCPEAGGNMIVKANIGAAGKVLSVELERLYDPMGTALAKAVNLWRYRPGTIARLPTLATVMIEFECGARRTFDSTIEAPARAVTPPVRLNNVEPEYPYEARNIKRKGTVKLTFVVDQTGHTTDIHVTDPLGFGTDEAVVGAVKQWRFTPAKKNQQPVNFQLASQTDFDLR